MVKKIVFFGDSITEGQYVEPPYRWTDLLEKRILGSEEGAQVLNKGISGQTSRQALLRFENDVQAVCPDILTIQFGLNDCNYWDTDRGHPRVSLESYAANIQEMIDRAIIFGVKKIVIANNHRTLRTKILSGGKSLEDSRLIYNDAIKKVAHKNNVLFCDIDAWFNLVDDDLYPCYLLSEPDLLHLSRKGHEYYAEKMFSVLSPLLEK